MLVLRQGLGGMNEECADEGRSVLESWQPVSHPLAHPGVFGECTTGTVRAIERFDYLLASLRDALLFGA
jgi:hypothetical protein